MTSLHPTSLKPDSARTPSRQAGPVPFSYRALAVGLNAIGELTPELSARILQSLWFRPLHARPSSRARAFWRTAERRQAITTRQSVLDVHFWGDAEAPLVVGVHGWRGSGVQFRHLVEPLVAAGYQVALFDLPAHGPHKTRFTHVFEFSQALLDFQEQAGQPTVVMAHSIGCQVVIQAMAQGFQTLSLVCFAPGINMGAMMQRFSELLGLTDRVSRRFIERVASYSRTISRQWVGTNQTLIERLSHDFTRQHLNGPGLLVADDQDEEIDWQDTVTLADYWQEAETHYTSGLGHNRILKEAEVINAVLTFLDKQDSRLG